MVCLCVAHLSECWLRVPAEVLLPEVTICQPSVYRLFISHLYQVNGISYN